MSRAHGKKMTLRSYYKLALKNKTGVFARNKQTHDISSKNQAFEPPISHKTIHGKRMLGSKNQA